MKAISRRYWVQAVSPLFVVGLVTALMAGGMVAGAYSTTAQAQGAANAMAVDAVSGGSVDPSRTVGEAAPVFDVSLHISTAGELYQGYNAVLEYDSAVINFVPVGATKATHLNAAVHGMSLEASTTDVPAGGTMRRTKAGAATIEGPIAFVGEVVQVRYECVGNGSTNLVLVPPAGAVGNSTTLGAGGVRIDTDLTSATVTCEGFGEATAMATATPTPTQGDTPPTPTGPTPTPTPLPPGFEAVPLVAGCNPVASTYPDGTPIQTIADAVGPAGNLVSLWKLDFGTWQAFSPQYPADSDLTQADILDVLFACVGGTGAFVRPVV